MKKLIPLALAVAVLAIAAAASATHTTTGNFSACYNNTSGAVRLIKETGLASKCPTGYTAFGFPSRAAREARIHFFDSPGYSLPNDGTTWRTLVAGDYTKQKHTWSVLVDGSLYPQTATAMLEVGVEMVPDAQVCVRLFDVTANAAVAGSEGCRTNTALDTYRFRTPGISLPKALHEYVVQGRSSMAAQGFVYSAAMVIDW